ncbi:unnamed protein product [Caretta caretta]
MWTVHFADAVELEKCLLPGWDPERLIEEVQGMDSGSESEDSEGPSFIEVDEDDEERTRHSSASRIPGWWTLELTLR